MSKSCVICGSEESEGELLVEAPCGRHWVCADDVGSFFENATNNESLFPPQCCNVMFMLDDYEDYVPFEVAWAYQMKQQGEYSILNKFRTYCANPACAKFLHPGSHVEDHESKITYAICEAEDCGKLTCVKCRTLLDQGTQNHECKQDEDERRFKQTANEKGYQECFVCGATVELAEACNHITCECGNSFCYICGENWPGLHGCPHYGSAVYDEEGYNQDGYHRDTGLNREGLTRRQEMFRNRAADEAQDDDDDDEADEGGGEDPEWEILQHLNPDQRALINLLPQEARDDALDQHRIDLFENQGITFDHFRPENHGDDQDNDDGEEEEDDGDDNDWGTEDDEEDLDGGQNDMPQPEVDATAQAPAEPAVDEDLLPNAGHAEVQLDVIEGVDPQEIPGAFTLGEDEAQPLASSDPNTGAEDVQQRTDTPTQPASTNRQDTDDTLVVR